MIEYRISGTCNVDAEQLAKIEKRFSDSMVIEAEPFHEHDDLFLVEFRWVDLDQIKEIDVFLRSLFQKGLYE